MFDDLRQDSASIYEDEVSKPSAYAKRTSAPKKRSKKILGMTGPQRFTLSFMFMLTVAIIGFMFMLVTGKMAF